MFYKCTQYIVVKSTIETMSPPLNYLITTSLLLTLFLLHSSSQVNSQSTTLYSPVTKDATTNLYTMLIYLKTPLQPSQLHLDLGSYLPFYDCIRHYKSSSYKPLIYNESLCIDLQTGFYSTCDDYPPGPGCSNDTCSTFPQNPVTLKSGIGQINTDVFALPGTKNPGQPVPISRLVFTCTYPNKYSKVYRGLAKGSTGLASLGRFKYSLSAQISRGSSSPWIFALCLPSSSESSGIVLFNSAGPYYFSPKIDVSKVLTYTPLIRGPKGVNTEVMGVFNSSDYYIGLSSLRVGDRVVRLNQTLLAIDEKGHGGTLINTSSTYTVVESSIYRGLEEAFVSESGKLKLTVSKPVAPFTVCFEADKVPTTRMGPGVPTVDLVFKSSGNFWRIYGSNSMVRIGSALCLGFVDGGPRVNTAVVIGGRQIEDNLLQFDLEHARVGFSSTLLLQSTTCSKYMFETK